MNYGKFCIRLKFVVTATEIISSDLTVDILCYVENAKCGNVADHSIRVMEN